MSVDEVREARVAVLASWPRLAVVSEGRARGSRGGRALVSGGEPGGGAASARHRSRWTFLLLGWLALCVPSLALASEETGFGDAALASGDRAWEERAVGESEGVPRRAPIDAAIGHYDEALSAGTAPVASAWRLLRALHFAIEFGGRPASERADRVERALDVAEGALDALATRAGGTRLDELDDSGAARAASALTTAGVDPADAGRLHFWAAIVWGAWSQDAGLLAAVREGVANRIHRYARLAAELDPGHEEGGAFRLLGRLHATLPRVPFITGWVDRAQAVRLVERAHALAPDHPGNRYLRGLTWFELDPERREAGLRAVEEVAALEPRGSARIEDLAIRAAAREWLAERSAESVAEAGE